MPRTEKTWRYDSAKNSLTRVQDAHLVEDKFGGEENQGFFGVYDGHGTVVGVRNVTILKGAKRQRTILLTTFTR